MRCVQKFTILLLVTISTSGAYAQSLNTLNSTYNNIPTYNDTVIEQGPQLPANLVDAQTLSNQIESANDVWVYITMHNPNGQAQKVPVLVDKQNLMLQMQQINNGYFEKRQHEKTIALVP